MDIKCRIIQENDLEMIMNWRMLPYITKYMNTDPKLTLTDQQKWYKSIDGINNISWVISVDGTPVGVLSIFNIDYVNEHCSWGYYIAEKNKRSLQLAVDIECNINDYAFNKLDMERLTNEVLEINRDVVKLHELCGSTCEGVLKKHIKKENRFYDIFYMAIIKDEWTEKRKKIKYNKIEFEEYTKYEVRK